MFQVTQKKAIPIDSGKKTPTVASTSKENEEETSRKIQYLICENDIE